MKPFPVPAARSPGRRQREGLDKIDLKILRALQEDASHSAAHIADAVGLSQSPCWRRIQRLKDEGYISRIVAVLDRSKLDLATQLFVQVKVIRNDQRAWRSSPMRSAASRKCWSAT